MESPKGAFKHSHPKNHRRSKKRKYLQWSAKNWKKIDTLPQTLLRKHYRSIRTTFSKNTFGELLPVFFKQFNLKIRCFILKFQKLFSHRIFKSGYTFLHFLRVCRDVYP